MNLSLNKILPSKGWQCVIGGFIIHLVLGTLYCWANITSAVTSYLRQYDQRIAYNDTLMVYGLTIFAQGCTMFIGGLLSQKIGAKKCIALAGVILISGTFSASLATTLPEMILCQGIMLGMGIGLSYSAPISAAVRWMPKRKGMVTGIIVGGFGFGAFVFGSIALELVNPNRDAVESSGVNKGYFPPNSRVVQNVPHMFSSLGLIYIAFFLVGIFLISDPPSETVINDVPQKVIETTKSPYTYQQASTIEAIEEIEMNSKIENKYSNQYQPVVNFEDTSKASESTTIIEDALIQENDITTSELIRSPLAWHLAACFITTTAGGMYLAGTFKTYGQQTIHDEAFLAIVSSISSIFNSSGRILWGTLGDYFGPLRTLMILTLCFTLIIFTFPDSVQLGKEAFGLWTFMIFLFEGANFVLYVPITVSLFGSKYSASNYGLIFTGYTFFSVFNIILLANINVSFRRAGVLMGLLTFVGFLNLILLHYHIKYRSQQISNCKIR